MSLYGCSLRCGLHMPGFILVRFAPHFRLLGAKRLQGKAFREWEARMLKKVGCKVPLAPRPSPLRAQTEHSPHCLRSRPVTDSARSFASGAQEPQDADFQSARCTRCPIRSHGILSLRRSAGNSSGGTVRDGHTCDAHPAQRTPLCTHCRWRRQLRWDERSCGLIPVLSVHRPPLGSSERNAQKGGGASHCKA